MLLNVSDYCIAGNFGGDKFWQIAKILVIL